MEIFDKSEERTYERAGTDSKLTLKFPVFASATLGFCLALFAVRVRILLSVCCGADVES